MNRHAQLHRYGLFDAKVPRYTSYPPANHFSANAGALHQREWLGTVQEGTQISLYLHIPFCKRLCWFCACRTQGTQTLRPVDAYVSILIREIAEVRALLPKNISLSRLHLGGGTPTILSCPTMTLLLDQIFEAFDTAESFEFSVEIDPTEASEALLKLLARYGMNRASIGVQDFDPKVQSAIGRVQSYEQTHAAVKTLRDAGVPSLNMDLLYGLPYQTSAGLTLSLEKVLALQPDRLALYGYAHVPWMSKRQVMIDSTTLPHPEERFELAELARELLCMDGYLPVGIDHFARPEDALATAMQQGNLRRNFQGYCDDPSEVLIGMGASAISKFPQGYCQNLASTVAYSTAIDRNGLAGARGHVLSAEDQVAARMIEQLLCVFRIDAAEVSAEFPDHADAIATSIGSLAHAFPEACSHKHGNLVVKPGYQALARVMASHLDQFSTDQLAHSTAI